MPDSSDEHSAGQEKSEGRPFYIFCSALVGTQIAVMLMYFVTATRS
jgi:hypothetical protein